MNKLIPAIMSAALAISPSTSSRAKSQDTLQFVEFSEECSPIVGIHRRVNELLVICNSEISTFDNKNPIGNGELTSTGEGTSLIGNMLGIKNGETISDPKSGLVFSNNKGKVTAILKGKIFTRPYSSNQVFLSKQGEVNIVQGRPEYKETLEDNGYSCVKLSDFIDLTIGETRYAQVVDSILCISKQKDT